ncbi:MAG: hypothetical protein ACKV19_06490 [Verrucomicrobiales bacterium]
MSIFGNVRRRVFAAAGLGLAGLGGWLIFRPPLIGPSVAPLPAPSDAVPARPQKIGWKPSLSLSLWQGSPDFLTQMTAENWREKLRAYPLPAADAGSVKKTEWSLAFSRAGFLAGRVAVETLLIEDQVAGGGFRQSAEAFDGWVAKDPEAAWAWLSESTDDRLRSALLPRFTWRLSEEATKLAIEDFSNLPAEDQRSLAVATTLDLLQSAGYEAADDLLDRQGPEGADQEAAEQTRQVIFDVLMQQRQTAVANGGSLDEVCEWLGTYADRAYVRPEHFAEVASLLGAQQGPASAATWLAALVNDQTAPPVQEVLSHNFLRWTEDDPSAAATWLESQRQHPAYEQLAAQLAAGRQHD